MTFVTEAFTAAVCSAVALIESVGASSIKMFLLERQGWGCVCV